MRFLEDHPCKHLALGKVPVSPWTTQSSVLVGTNKPRAVGMARGTGKESQGPAWPGAEHCSEWRSGEHSQCYEHMSLSQPPAVVAADRKTSDCPKSAKARAAKPFRPLFLELCSKVGPSLGSWGSFPLGGGVYV